MGMAIGRTRPWLRRRLWGLTIVALVAASLATVGAETADALTLPNDVGGHQHVHGLLDITNHRCGTVVQGSDGNGRQTNPATYDYSIPSELGDAAGNAVDHHWVHDEDDGPLTNALVFDLGDSSTVVDLFPAIDHGPVPGEALEATVYGFDRLDDPASEWETGDISMLFDDGWSDWISDDFVSRWSFARPHRYVGVRWGGPKAVVADGDAEIDAACAPAAAGILARAGTDQAVPEGSVVTLDGSGSVGLTDGGLSYSWKLVSASGPPVVLSNQSAPQLSFRALDDGEYRFRLTVTEAGLVNGDEVVVRVDNAAPVIGAQAAPAADDGLALVTTTLSDVGVFDVHTATYDWGDGSAPETFAVVQGPGWAYVHGGHAYAVLGDYTVQVTVADDDGGTATTQTLIDVGGGGSADPRPVPAIWANSRTAKNAVDLTGGPQTYAGLVHSNNDIRLTGDPKALTGGTQHATGITTSGGPHTINPAATTTTPSGFPVEWPLADYQPGGRAALAAGAAFRDMTTACKNKWWQPTTPLADGVYWVPCSVKVNGSQFTGGHVTIAAAGEIDVTGAGAQFLDAYADGLLFVSGSGSRTAVKIAGSDSTFGGSVYAPAGGISVTGSRHTFQCGLLGDVVSVSGTTTKVDIATCRYATDQNGPIPVAAPPLVVPTLGVHVAVDPTTVGPGGELAYEGSVTNDGARFVAPGLVGVVNTGATPATVDGVDASLDYFDEPTQAWVTLATTADDSLALALAPITTPGVTYPATGGAAGTTLAPGSRAAWSLAAQASLTPAQLALLLDPARASAVRVVVEFTATGTTRTFTRFEANLVDGVRAQGADVDDVELTFVPAVGDPAILTAADLAGLASIPPGGSVPFTATAAIPSVPARADGESSVAYLARLLARDNLPLVGAASAIGTSGQGTIIAPQQLASATERVAAVAIDLVAPAAVTTNSAITYDIRLTNQGSTAAIAPVVTLTTSAGPVAVTDVPATIEPGQTVVAHAATTAGAAGTLDATAQVTWTTAGTPDGFGPTDDTATTRILAAAVLPVTVAEVTGRFFHAPANATAFTATPADIPVFAQQFPNIAFNPPSGVVPGNTTVSPATRPFTDVLVNPDGEAAGTVIAQGNGHQAGAGDMASFQSVFTGEIEVTRAGATTFSIIADDGFIFGVGGGATRVSGPLDNAPATTPFESLPVLGAHNAAGLLATYPVTISFPAPGRYFFELDYFTAVTDSMSLVLTVPGDPEEGFGGRVFLTGHDPDFHAFRGGNRTGAQHMIQQAIRYVTGNEPEPRILLVTDRRDLGSAYSDPRLGLIAAGFSGFDMADHGSGTAGVLNLNTVVFENYDVVVVASDHGGWLRQQQLDILNQRKNDLAQYLLAGGGIVAFAEGSPGAGLTTHDRFAFVPCASIGFDQTESGFRITPQGTAIGLNQSDLNGNFSHNFFPGTCGMDVLDTDAQGRIMSLATAGSVGGPTHVVPPTNYLLLSPPSATAHTGTDVTLTAQALDAAGNPRPGVSVVFDIVGANPANPIATTDAAGNAVVVHRGTVAGTDTVQASRARRRRGRRLERDQHRLDHAARWRRGRWWGRRRAR